MRFTETLIRVRKDERCPAETQMVALFEVQALFGSSTQPGGVVANPRQPWTVIKVQVQLQDVADLTHVSQQTFLATTAQELTGDSTSVLKIAASLRNIPTKDVWPDITSPRWLGIIRLII